MQTNPNDPVYSEGTTGLTKREYFAVLAMQGIMAGKIQTYRGDYENNSPETVAQYSLQYADALINKLNQQR